MSGSAAPVEPVSVRVTRQPELGPAHGEQEA